MALVGASLTSQVIKVTPISPEILSSCPYNCWPLLLRMSVNGNFFQVSPDRPNPRRSHLPNGERANGRGEHFEEGQLEEDVGRFGHRRRKLHHSILQKADHLRPFRSRRKHASGDFAFIAGSTVVSYQNESFSSK